MDIEYNNIRFVYSLIDVGISFIIVCGILFVILFFAINHDNNAAAAFAVVGENRNNPLTLTKGSVYDYKSIITMIQPISFVEDTLFPQSFVSTPSGSDITLANGITLADRPITLIVNKIQSNNTLTLSLYSLNDKYLLTGDLKGPAKANSTADNAQFSLKGNINLNKNTSYSVVGILAETKTKGLTLTINDAKNQNNFKATIGFSPPHSEGRLVE